MTDSPIDRIKRLIDEGLPLAEAKAAVYAELSPEGKQQAEALWDMLGQDHTTALRSELWEQADGSYRWELRHPESGRKTRGHSESVTEAYGRMDEIVEEWFGTPARNDLVLLTHPDGDTGPDNWHE